MNILHIQFSLLRHCFLKLRLIYKPKRRQTAYTKRVITKITPKMKTIFFSAEVKRQNEKEECEKNLLWTIFFHNIKSPYMYVQFTYVNMNIYIRKTNVRIKKEMKGDYGVMKRQYKCMYIWMKNYFRWKYCVIRWEFLIFFPYINTHKYIIDMRHKV